MPSLGRRRRSCTRESTCREKGLLDALLSEQLYSSPSVEHHAAEKIRVAVCLQGEMSTLIEPSAEGSSSARTLMTRKLACSGRKGQPWFNHVGQLTHLHVDSSKEEVSPRVGDQHLSPGTNSVAVHSVRGTVQQGQQCPRYNVRWFEAHYNRFKEKYCFRRRRRSASASSETTRPTHEEQTLGTRDGPVVLAEFSSDDRGGSESEGQQLTQSHTEADRRAETRRSARSPLPLLTRQLTRIV